MRGRNKLFVFICAVVILASLVMVPTVRVDAASSLSITFPSGLTLSSPINTTYSSSVLSCNGSFTGPLDWEITLNYTIDGNYQGYLPWKLNSSNAVNYTIDWGFQLPHLSQGPHRLNIGIDQQLYSGVTVINQITHVNTVYFAISPTLVTVNQIILIISPIAIVVALVIVLLIYRSRRKTKSTNID